MAHEWTEGSYVYQVCGGECRWRHMADDPDAWCTDDLSSWQLSRVLREMSRLAARVEVLESLKPKGVSNAEGSEIVGELASALAVLAGEDLKPCTAPCRGHLREKAAEATRSALLAWRALQEGNRRAAARIAELEARASEAAAIRQEGRNEGWSDAAKLVREIWEIWRPGDPSGGCAEDLLANLPQWLREDRERLQAGRST